jgi:hypothetical protein
MASYSRRGRGSEASSRRDNNDDDDEKNERQDKRQERSTKTDDKEEKKSSSNMVMAVGRQILPFVAVFAAAGAAVKATSLFQKTVKENELSEKLGPYKYLSAAIGESAHMRRLLYFTCLSPSWHEKYFFMANYVIEMWNNCHNMTLTTNQYIEETRQLAKNFLELGDQTKEAKKNLKKSRGDWDKCVKEFKQVCNDQIDNAYYLRQYGRKTQFNLVSMIEACMACRTVIVQYSTLMGVLARAYNLFIGKVANIYMTDMSEEENETVREQDHKDKMLLVTSIAKYGLSAFYNPAYNRRVLKVLAKSNKRAKRDDNEDDESELENEKYDDEASIITDNEFGMRKKLITRHVIWWNRIITTFSPQMARVAKELEWDEADHCEILEANNRYGVKFINRIQKKIDKTLGDRRKDGDNDGDDDQDKSSKSRKTIPTKHSNLVDRGMRAFDRIKTEGLRSVFKKPWHGLQPSPHEKSFLPDVVLNEDGLKEALKSIEEFIDMCIDVMFECHECVIEQSKEIEKVSQDIIDTVARSRQTLLGDWHDHMGRKMSTEEIQEIIYAKQAKARLKYAKNAWDGLE